MKINILIETNELSLTLIVCQDAHQKQLDADLSATIHRVEETARLVDCRSAELRAKQVVLIKYFKLLSMTLSVN